MQAKRIMANLRVADVDEAKGFYTDFLGLRNEEFNMGWVARNSQKLGYEIVHPLTKEPWGVRRFLVRAPDGNVVNIVDHRD